MLRKLQIFGKHSYRHLFLLMLEANNVLAIYSIVVRPTSEGCLYALIRVYKALVLC